MQDEKKQAKIRDELHVLLGCFCPGSSCCGGVAFFFFSFLFFFFLLRSILERNYAQGREGKTARVPAGAHSQERREKVWAAFPKSEAANGQTRERTASSLRFFSFLNASCSIIIHKFILFKPLLCLYPHSGPGAPPSVLSLTFFVDLSPPVMGIRVWSWITHIPWFFSGTDFLYFSLSYLVSYFIIVSDIYKTSPYITISEYNDF